MRKILTYIAILLAIIFAIWYILCPQSPYNRVKLISPPAKSISEKSLKQISQTKNFPADESSGKFDKTKHTTKQNLADMAQKADSLFSAASHWVRGVLSKFKDNKDYPLITNENGVKIYAKEDFDKSYAKMIIAKFKDADLMKNINGYEKSIYFDTPNTNIVEIHIFNEPKDGVKPLINDIGQTKFELYFDSGKSTPNDEKKLNQVIEQIGNKFVKSLTIEGYTDSSGGEWLNKELSMKRALNIAKAIPDSLYKKIIANGLADPQAPNDTSSGKALNRRVIITLE